MSIGCAIYPQDAVDQSSLLSCADMALHDLKARGRGGIRMYNPSMMQLTEAIASQLNIARQLIRHHTIQPYYQPKVDLKHILSWALKHYSVGTRRRLRQVYLLRLLKLSKITI